MEVHVSATPHSEAVFPTRGASQRSMTTAPAPEAAIDTRAAAG